MIIYTVLDPESLDVSVHTTLKDIIKAEGLEDLYLLKFDTEGRFDYIVPLTTEELERHFETHGAARIVDDLLSEDSVCYIDQHEI